MGKALWELSIEELDKEIATTKAMLQAGGYHKLMADHLAVLEEQREERLIEADILKGSRYAQEVLHAGESVVETRVED